MCSYRLGLGNSKLKASHHTEPHENINRLCHQKSQKSSLRALLQYPVHPSVTHLLSQRSKHPLPSKITSTQGSWAYLLPPPHRAPPTCPTSPPTFPIFPLPLLRLLPLKRQICSNSDNPKNVLDPLLLPQTSSIFLFLGGEKLSLLFLHLPSILFLLDSTPIITLTLTCPWSQ